MKPLKHPLDAMLGHRGWQRARLDDVRGESSKLAARLICRAVSLPGTSAPLAIIDVNLWLKGDKVHAELASPEVPSFLETMVAQGILGVVPHAFGLTPCRHEPWHWNPFCLPLVWDQTMNTAVSLDVLAKGYVEALRDSSWQCPDAAQLMR